MFGILLIVYIVFCSAAIFGGYYMKNVAVKDEEMKYGLRTSQTQKSPDTWEYANGTLGKHWLRVGIIGLILGIPFALLMYSFKGENIAKALIFVYLVFIASIISSSVISVMRDISSKFDENGRPIERE